MAISRISAAAAQAATVNITTPVKGDLILVWAHRDGSATAPSLITGYTNHNQGGGSTNSSRLMWKISDGTETATGSSTNATSIGAVVYRGADPNVPLGAVLRTTGSGTTLTYGTITLQVTRDTSSWVAGFGAHRTATDVNQAPTGMTNITSATDIALNDTNAAVASWSSNTDGVNASSGWVTDVVEIRMAQDAAPSPDPHVQTISFSDRGEASTTPFTLKINFAHTTLANNLLVLVFTHTTGVSITSVVDSNAVSWTAGPTAINGNGNHDSRLYYLPGAAATVSVTITFSASALTLAGMLHEFWGAATSSVVDGTATSTNSDTSPLIQSGSITTTQAGDLIYHYAQDVVTGSFGNNTQCDGIAADGGFALLAAHRWDVSAAQYTIQASAGAINPQLTFLQPGNPDPYNSLSIAWKMNGSGTAPSGMRIVRVSGFPAPGVAAYSHQFPTSGNLIVASDPPSISQNSITSLNDLQSTTYTKVALDNTTPQQFHGGNATPSLVRRIAFVSASAGNAFWRVYDIAGAATSPAGTGTWANGTQGAANADIIGAPVLTPTSAGGIVIFAMNMGSGPPKDMINAGDVIDNCWYPGETDAGNMNYGDGTGHRVNAAASSHSYDWHTANVSASSYIGQAIPFYAPAVTAPFPPWPRPQVRNIGPILAQ